MYTRCECQWVKNSWSVTWPSKHFLEWRMCTIRIHRQHSGMSVQEKDIKAGLWCFLTHLGVFLNWIEMIQVYVDWGYVHWSRLIAATAGLTLAHQMKHFASMVICFQKRKHAHRGEKTLLRFWWFCLWSLIVKWRPDCKNWNYNCQYTASVPMYSQFCVCYDLFVQY